MKIFYRVFGLAVMALGIGAFLVNDERSVMVYIGGGAILWFGYQLAFGKEEAEPEMDEAQAELLRAAGQQVMACDDCGAAVQVERFIEADGCPECGGKSISAPDAE